jgi:hypothetical protein
MREGHHEEGHPSAVARFFIATQHVFDGPQRLYLRCHSHPYTQQQPQQQQQQLSGVAKMCDLPSCE